MTPKLHPWILSMDHPIIFFLDHPKFLLRDTLCPILKIFRILIKQVVISREEYDIMT